MNLITDKWLPVKTKSGSRIKIRPSEITLNFNDDPIIDFDFSRPDFRGSAVQFLIGLLQTCCIPDSEEKWRTWTKGKNGVPSPNILQASFDKAAFAFNLNGEGPRFMQDFDLDTKKLESKSIGSLLIDEPGDQTLKLNKDLFVKRNQIEQLSLPMAALALFALQLQAPSGGAGHRTSLRGGGPLTTLILPTKQNEDLTLWELLWVNILPEDQFFDYQNWEDEPSKVFPWLTKTITSESSKAVTPMDASPLMMFWATPRRVCLDFSTAEHGICSISGQEGLCVKAYYTQNYGANYTGWQHVLSPHYKQGSDTLPIHPNAGGMTYKQWLGWILGDSDRKSPVFQSKNIHYAQTHRKLSSKNNVIWAFGFDMDNMKARGWQESKIPLLVFDDEAQVKEASGDIRRALEAADVASFLLRKQVRTAWNLDSGNMDMIDQEFWSSTQHAFEDFLNDLYGLYNQPDPVSQTEKTRLSKAQENWSKVLQNSILALYDKWTGSGNLEFENISGIIKSRKVLHSRKTINSIRDKIGLPEVKHV